MSSSSWNKTVSTRKKCRQPEHNAHIDDNNEEQRSAMQPMIFFPSSESNDGSWATKIRRYNAVIVSLSVHISASKNSIETSGFCYILRLLLLSLLFLSMLQTRLGYSSGFVNHFPFQKRELLSRCFIASRERGKLMMLRLYFFHVFSLPGLRRRLIPHQRKRL